jgi:hypothetical protein
MEIKEFINKWMSSDLIYDNYSKNESCRTDNLQYVMDEDREFAKNNVGYAFGKCIGIIENYLIIQDKRGILRIMPELIHRIYPTPKFEWGNKVQEVARPEIKGEIENIIWHMKDNEFKYFIKVNGKSKSRRYNPDELELVKENK